MASVILNNGKRMPWIGYGTGTALYAQPADRQVRMALDAGFMHIDTAESYRNEDSVGVALGALSAPARESLFLTTKLASLEPGGTVRDHLKESLRKLGLDYVDLYLLHTPIPFQGRIKEIWKEFEAVYEEGLARNIGVSNFRVQDFGELLEDAKVIPVVNQIEFNPYVLAATEPILAVHGKYGIKTSSYGGLIPLSRKTGGPLDALLPGICERLTKDAGKPVNESQVLIKWLLARQVIPITTSSKKERLTNILETSELPDLTPEEIGEIDEAGRKIHHRVYQRHMDS